VTVELVYDPDCPNAAEARTNLRRALVEAGIATQWVEWNRSARGTPARVKGFGSPTVLVDGRDAAGAQPSEAACWRIYEFAGARSGAPPAELIACALVAAKRRERPSGAARALAALAAAIALVRLASPAGGLAAAESIPAASSAGTVAIPIEGMTCASCAAQVKKALRALDGVSDVEVSLEHRIARVRYTADKVKPEDLVGAIDRLGYKAGPPTLADDAP